MKYSAEIEEIGAGAFENTSISELRLPYLNEIDTDNSTAKLGYYFGGENNTVPGSL